MGKKTTKKTLRSTVRAVNASLRNRLGEEAFEVRLRELLQRGLVEIVSVDQTGMPDVRVTQKGLKEFEAQVGQ